MTIDEIKGLTKYLSEEEIEKIKEEMKSKENVLKSGKLDEEEMINVLNSFFAILVIEKILESEIEDVEDLRAELENELLEAYQVYDSYMIKYKKDDKKKKKNWLLRFLSLSDLIHDKKQDIGGATKSIGAMQKQLNEIKQKKNDSNLQNVANKCNHDMEDFCSHPFHCDNPLHHHPRPDRFHERHHRHDHNRHIEHSNLETKIEKKSIDGSKKKANVCKSRFR